MKRDEYVTVNCLLNQGNTASSDAAVKESSSELRAPRGFQQSSLPEANSTYMYILSGDNEPCILLSLSRMNAAARHSTAHLQHALVPIIKVLIYTHNTVATVITSRRPPLYARRAQSFSLRARSLSLSFSSALGALFRLIKQSRRSIYTYTCVYEPPLTRPGFSFAVNVYMRGSSGAARLHARLWIYTRGRVYARPTGK